MAAVSRGIGVDGTDQSAQRSRRGQGRNQHVRTGFQTRPAGKQQYSDGSGEPSSQEILLTQKASKQRFVSRSEHHWIILILSMAAAAGLAVKLGQDSGFDLLNYHYYSGFAFLNKPFGYDLAPAQVQSFHNPLIHILSYLALAFLPATGAAALLGAIQGLNIYLVFRISQSLFSGFGKSLRFILSLMSAGVGFYGITACTELGTTYGDNLISILVLSGLLLIIRRLQMGRISDRWTPLVFGISGLIIGAASGLKLTAAAYVLAVAVSTPIVLFKSRCFRKIVAAHYAGLAAGFLATYGFWGLSLYSAYGNPFLPYLNKIFRSPFMSFENFRDIRFLPGTWQQVFFYPFYFIQKNHLVSEIDFRDLRLALCFCAVVLLIGIGLFRFARKTRKNAAESVEQQNDQRLLFLTVFFCVSYISWESQSSIYRYLAVLELVAPAYLALVLSRFLRKRLLVLCASAILNLAIVIAAVPIDFGRQRFDNELLKLEVPGIRDLDKSIVLMTGYDGTAYIAPSFPGNTRFARISSTLITPGRNAFIDETIRKLLASYDGEHTFAYVPNADETGLARLDTSFYGRMMDRNSCFEIRSGERNRGYLCGIVGSPVAAAGKPLPQLGPSPKFINTGILKLDLRISKKYIDCRIPGTKAASVDILYKLDGEIMPPIRNWGLEPDSLLHLGPMGRDGLYTIIGIREFGAADPDLWMPTNADARISTK